MLPITSLHLDHKASAARVPTGIARLDEMLGGKGIFRGSSVLVSGSPGTGKSSIGAKFVDAACRRGENALLFAYEESSAQMLACRFRPLGLGFRQACRRKLRQLDIDRHQEHAGATLLLLQNVDLLMRDGAAAGERGERSDNEDNV